MIRGIQGTIAEKLPDVIIEANDDSIKTQAQRILQEKCIAYVLSKLQAELTMQNYPTEDVNNVIGEYRNMLLNLQRNNPSMTQMIKFDDKINAIKKKALYYELQQIHEAYDNGKINRKQHAQLRQAVYLMELDVNDVI